MARHGLRVLAVGFATLIALAWATEARAQCDWRTDYATYKVRSVSVKVAAIFGAVPEALKQNLSRHRRELYTSDKPNEYANEVKDFVDNDPVELKYEKLVANKLKFSFKGFKYESCVEKLEATECEREFKGDPGAPVTQCLDVIVRRRGVEVDALNTTPYLVLFPRSTLVKLLGAVPRPLLALNPGIDVDFDREFGPSATIDTSTDLLDLHAMFKNSPQTVETQKHEALPSVTPANQAPASVTTAGDLDISVPPQSGATPATGTVAPDTPALGRDTKLLLNVKAQKSIDKSFYNTDTGLVFSRAKALKRFQNLVLETNFIANNRPQGEGTFLQNSVTAGGSTDVRVKIGPFRLINLGGKYRWSSNRFFRTSTTSELTSENAMEGRVFADGNLKNGLLRASVWFDSGWPSVRSDNYQRLAVVAGYSKEFVMPRKKEYHKIALFGSECYTPYEETPKTNDPAIGVEVLAGAGRAWGKVPEYARFYGGNSSTNFLYDEPSSQNLVAFPGGPLLRSAKRQQAGILTGSGSIFGGTSYWHFNANVSLPIPGWSQPLIPAELVGSTPRQKNETELDGKVPEGELVCRDLKFQIKSQVRKGGRELLLARVAHDALSKAEQDALRRSPRDPNLSAAELQAVNDATAAYQAAKKRLAPEVDRTIQEEIAPITDFIADHADIYSIKPLMMVEAARLDAPDAIRSRTRYGFGGGLQVNVVTVRFEAGYLFAANRLPGDGHGNFVFRMVFRRFF